LGAMLKKTGLSISFLCVFLLMGCGGPRGHYVLVDRQIQQHRYEEADAALEKNRTAYGARNAVLYDFDRAVTLHLSGRFAESNEHLDRAERRIEDLYTKSVSSETGAMLTNDSLLPYEGEDFEKVMINILAALNYASMSQWDDALVEARRVDHKLGVMNGRYENKNIYKEDAFARYLSAILFEGKGETNDAFIAYRKAYEAYEEYRKAYQSPVPPGLPADLLRVTEAMGLTEEHQAYREKFPNTRWLPQREERQKAEVIFISLDGLAPIKEDNFIDAPIPDGKKDLYILRIALPRFVERTTDLAYAEVHLIGAEGAVASQRTFLAEDITAIARKNLEDRVGRITAKAIARAAAKYAASRTMEHKVTKSSGELAGEIAGLLSNVYAVASEQADKRSWRTLPGQIRMARLTAPPGTYKLSVEYYSVDQRLIHRKEETLVLKAGEKRFLTSRVVGTPRSVPKKRSGQE
jgi:uncharacterized protein